MVFFFQAEDGIRDLVRSRGLGDVYKRQTVCPTGASYKREEDGIVLVNEDDCMGCGLCAWACPYGARELDLVSAVSYTHLTLPTKA